MLSHLLGILDPVLQDKNENNLANKHAIAWIPLCVCSCQKGNTYIEFYLAPVGNPQ